MEPDLSELVEEGVDDDELEGGKAIGVQVGKFDEIDSTRQVLEVVADCLLIPWIITFDVLAAQTSKTAVEGAAVAAQRTAGVAADHEEAALALHYHFLGCHADNSRL